LLHIPVAIELMADNTGENALGSSLYQQINPGCGLIPPRRLMPEKQLQAFLETLINAKVSEL